MQDVRGVGIGFRPQLAAAMFRAPQRFDFVEVVAESCARDVAARREAVALAEVWRVVPHGVKLSLGSAEGIDAERARSLGELARALRSPFVSEHVAFVRSGGHEIGHLTELPMTRASLRVLARNVDALRRHLPSDVPVILENAARGFVWTNDAHEMSEGDFYQEVVLQTGCELLLDVANVYANALNAGIDPGLLLRTYPLDRVRMMHVAGGTLENGFYFDTHAHPVPDAVFELVRRVLATNPEAATLLERDAALGDPEAIFTEVDRLCELGPAPTTRRSHLYVPARQSPRDEHGPELARAQTALAKRLLATDEDTDAVTRARSVLARKRAA
jgi:uncharacterized protein (UPF0276 family)